VAFVALHRNMLSHATHQSVRMQAMSLCHANMLHRCCRWFSTTKEDGRISRILYPGSQHGPSTYKASHARNHGVPIPSGMTTQMCHDFASLSRPLPMRSAAGRGGEGKLSCRLHHPPGVPPWWHVRRWWC
jgi:hypothetical protein